MSRSLRVAPYILPAVVTTAHQPRGQWGFATPVPSDDLRGPDVAQAELILRGATTPLPVRLGVHDVVSRALESTRLGMLIEAAALGDALPVDCADLAPLVDRWALAGWARQWRLAALAPASLRPTLWITQPQSPRVRVAWTALRLALVMPRTLWVTNDRPRIQWLVARWAQPRGLQELLDSDPDALLDSAHVRRWHGRWAPRLRAGWSIHRAVAALIEPALPPSLNAELIRGHQPRVVTPLRGVIRHNDNL